MKRGIFIYKLAPTPKIQSLRKVKMTNTTYGYLKDPDNLAVFEQFGWRKTTKKEVDSDKGDQWELIHYQCKLSDFIKSFPLD